MRLATTCTTLEDVDVECTHCGVKMTTHLGSSAHVRYFHCASCHRWVSSMYSEVLRSDAKIRARPRREGAFGGFGAVKERLEAWLQAIDGQDPYRTLGVSPADTSEHIRERYRELALEYHPDRGGDPARMKAINDAYDRIHAHRERRALGAVPRELPAAGGQ